MKRRLNADEKPVFHLCFICGSSSSVFPWPSPVWHRWILWRYLSRMMPHIFITAFEPYDEWDENASWLALVNFTKTLPANAKITTRRYPVDFAVVYDRLSRDLEEDFDYAIHLGQSPGSASIHLEAIALNIGGSLNARAETFQPLVEDGPVAYRSDLPLVEWSEQLRAREIPATVSYHAGTYLCNATLYLSHYLAQRQRRRTKSAFIHVPLDTSQTAKADKEVPALPASVTAAGLAIVVDDLIKRGRLAAQALA
jgi:pyroglutamyl-peptidase